MPGCPSCGEQNPERARFCLACGLPLSEAAPRREARRTVTVVFCDATDSTVLGERIDPESLRRVMTRYFDELRGALEGHGGTVEKFIGDAVMSVFGSPRVHEDDALRALRAAAEIRERVAALNAELERDWGVSLGIRTGLNTGEVVVDESGADQRLVTGDAVNVAARLQGAAAPGEILMGDGTHRLARNAVLAEPVEQLELKGKSEPVKAWRLLAVLADAAPVARRLDSPLVGRERELALLRQAFERAATEDSCHLFTLLGAAGAGKSRLANELATEIRERATVLTGRCLPYGEGITFWPVVEIVKRAAALSPALSPSEVRARIGEVVADERDAEVVVDRLAVMLGLGGQPASARDTFWAVRKLLEALARRRPLVVGFDDIHWADPTLLDLVEHITDWARDSPILIVCLARPELLEERPTWAGGKLNATSLLLEPLDHEACGRLVENLLASTAVEDDVKRRIAEAAEGNPLFVEEMLAMLIDDGVLREDGGRWVAAGSIAEITVPPTIQALLAARLDRLSPDELAVIERAAVAGKVFSRGAVRALDDGAGGGLDERLAALVRKQLIRPHRAVFAGEDTFRFRHILIRDAAYQAMPKDLRADLHERFVAWLHRAGGERTAEYEEILGYHLEQAHRFRTELAPADDRARSLAERASEHLASAGRRAFARGDMPAAVALLTRATMLLRDDEPAYAALAPDLGAALMDTGELERAEAVLSRAIEVANRANGAGFGAHAEIVLAHVHMRTDPSAAAEEAERVAEETIRAFEDVDDALGLAQARHLLAYVHVTKGKWGATQEVIERALADAERADDQRERAALLNALAACLYFGPAHVDDAITRSQAILEGGSGDRTLEAAVSALVAAMEAMRGRFEEARRLAGHSIAVFEDLGVLAWLAKGGRVFRGTVELLAGDPAAAVAEFRWCHETLLAMGDRDGASYAAALLAEALCEQERFDDADVFAHLASETASAWILTQTTALRARAAILGHRGDHAAALAAAREACRLAEETDSLNMRGDALRELGRALLSVGDRAAAAEALEDAAHLYGVKGNLVAARAAELLLDPSASRAVRSPSA